MGEGGRRRMERDHRLAWFVAAAMLLGSAEPGLAHHVMGGVPPERTLDGLLSGIGHPILGIEHLSFLVGVAVAAGIIGRTVTLPLLYVVATIIGASLQVDAIALPWPYAGMVLSILVVGGLIATGRRIGLAAWAAVFTLGGIYHGFSYAEVMVGTEPSPLTAYFVGLALVQSVLVVSIASAVKWLRESPALMLATVPRLAGFGLTAVGVALAVTSSIQA